MAAFATQIAKSSSCNWRVEHLHHNNVNNGYLLLGVHGELVSEVHEDDVLVEWLEGLGDVSGQNSWDHFTAVRQQNLALRDCFVINGSGQGFLQYKWWVMGQNVGARDRTKSGYSFWYWRFSFLGTSAKTKGSMASSFIGMSIITSSWDLLTMLYKPLNKSWRLCI